MSAATADVGKLMQPDQKQFRYTWDDWTSQMTSSDEVFQSYTRYVYCIFHTSCYQDLEEAVRERMHFI